MREYASNTPLLHVVAIRKQRGMFAADARRRRRFGAKRLIKPSRFSSNCSTGAPEVTSISPSTMAPLAMAMVRALTLPRITAV